MKHRKAKSKLCPFRKVVEREANDITGRAVERERFQPCIGGKCMAYVYTAPFITPDDDADDPANFGCAMILNRKG